MEVQHIKGFLLWIVSISYWLMCLNNAIHNINSSTGKMETQKWTDVEWKWVTIFTLRPGQLTTSNLCPWSRQHRQAFPPSWQLTKKHCSDLVQLSRDFPLCQRQEVNRCKQTPNEWIHLDVQKSLCCYISVKHRKANSPSVVMSWSRWARRGRERGLCVCCGGVLANVSRRS